MTNAFNACLFGTTDAGLQSTAVFNTGSTKQPTALAELLCCLIMSSSPREQLRFTPPVILHRTGERSPNKSVLPFKWDTDKTLTSTNKRNLNS